MKTQSTSFRTVAAELSAAFETAERPSGETFYRIGRNAAPWIESAELMRAAHTSVDGQDCRLPDDFIYRAAALAADFAAGFDSADDCRDSVSEFADRVADVSTSALFSWAAASAYNRALADEYFSEVMDGGRAMADGFESGAVAVLRGAQSLAAERVALSLVDAIESECAGR